MNYSHEVVERRSINAKPSRAVVLPKKDERWSYVMEGYLRKRGLPYKLAVSNGWYPSLDKEGVVRIVIPATSLVNSWPYYQARATDSRNRTRYLSPACPRGDALSVLYPPDEILGVVIVEGPMDALAAAECGYIGVGLMGNRPNDLVLTHLKSYLKNERECLVIPDSDALSEGAAICGALWKEGYECFCKPLRGYKDLAEMPLGERKEFLWE